MSARAGGLPQANRHQRHLGRGQAQRRTGAERGGHRRHPIPGEKPQQHGREAEEADTHRAQYVTFTFLLIISKLYRVRNHRC